MKISNADPATYARHRAKVVEAIRALADLVERDLALPVPHSVGAQYSMPGDLDDDQRQFAREIAAHLDVRDDASSGGSYTIDGPDYATVQFVVAKSEHPDEYFRVAYVVHGHRDGGDDA